GLTTFTQDLDENYTDFYYRWLNDFVNQLSLQDINIVGHSLGARIATVYAANSGETVKSIVAITPAYSPSLKGLVFIESAILKMLATRYGKMLDREVLKLFLHEMLLSKQRDTLTFLDFAIEEVIRDQSPLNMKGVLEALKWFQSERFAFENIRVLSDRIPVTILCGQKDIYCSNRELLDIVGSKLKLEIIKRSGHLLPLEHPKICSNRILSTVYSN
ncbi:alpha/beta fold hydrolase, partial [Polaromonas sp.]|nr:alpha/beta fold hydrolase [Candidatus Saccharibacteria bacterium]